MKHQWTEETQCVISALKEELASPCAAVETDLELYLVFQKHIWSVRKEYRDKRAFYQIWGEIPSAFRKKWGGTAFWQIWLCQAAVAVLQKKEPLTVKSRKDFDFFMEWFFREPDPVKVPYMPVRLPDKNLYTAVCNGDLAKIIFLYDSAVTQGQKMKNICHLLLNKRDYKTLTALHDVYGCLDMFDMEFLQPYQYWAVQSDGKEQFDLYCYRRSGTNEKNCWENQLKIGCLHSGITAALNAGMDPGKAMFTQDGYDFSLRQLMYFLDECREEFDKMYNLVHFKKLLAASGIFARWEKQKKIEAVDISEKRAEA